MLPFLSVPLNNNPRAAMFFPCGNDWPRYEMGLVIPTMLESFTAQAGSEGNLYINTAFSAAFANVLHRRPPVRVLNGRVYLNRVRTHFVFHLTHKYAPKPARTHPCALRELWIYFPRFVAVRDKMAVPEPFAT